MEECDLTIEALPQNLIEVDQVQALLFAGGYSCHWSNITAPQSLPVIEW